MPIYYYHTDNETGLVEADSLEDALAVATARHQTWLYVEDPESGAVLSPEEFALP